MNEQKYYKQIKELIETYEVNNKVRYLQDNHEKLLTNWKIGKTLVEAQGGLNRAKYGDGLIKKWAKNLEANYGKNYQDRELRKMRQFYLVFPNLPTVSANLSWSVMVELFSLKNENERSYYINQVILNNLSVRELRELIKSKAGDYCLLKIKKI